MIRFIFATFLILSVFSCNPLNANENNNINSGNNKIITDTVSFGHYNIILSYNKKDSTAAKRSKLLAITADILAGPLGGHRIYLGTKPWVPFVYALTLGGGLGFLPVADLFAIIFTKDLNNYVNCDELIMWL